MPRPSSVTVIEPSGLTVTWITVAWPAMTSSIELSTTSLDEVVQPADVAIADVHPRSLADVLQIAHVAHLADIVRIVVLGVGVLKNFVGIGIGIGVGISGHGFSFSVGYVGVRQIIAAF